MERDPQLARDLRIGRPDLLRNYDDGGLVDLCTAPAEVVSQVCGVDVAEARSIVGVAAARRGALTGLDELFVYVDVDPALWDRFRDHAIVLG